MSGHALFAGLIRLRGWLCLLLLLAIATEGFAEPWQGRLQGGAEVTVDPNTRRAMGTIKGSQRQLWDGVHRLEDGSTVTVRDGIAVPTTPMVERWGSEPRPEPVFEYRHCEQLVRKTCGFDGACNGSEACLRARALLGDETAEQRRIDQGLADDPQTATDARCLQGLSDPSFPACASLSAETGDSRCTALVERVCGAAGGCADSQACDAARQLQKLETEERLVNADPSALSLTGGQCLEAMTNAFFGPCGQDQDIDH